MELNLCTDYNNLYYKWCKVIGTFTISEYKRTSGNRCKKSKNRNQKGGPRTVK